MIFSPLSLCDYLASVVRLYSFYIPIFLSEPHNKRNRISAIKSFIKFLFFFLSWFVEPGFVLFPLGTDHLTCRGGLWFFVSFRIFFSDNTRGRIFIFFCRAKREIFFRSSTLGYMTKTLNQIIFFLHQNQNFCSATLGIRIFFQKKTITPPAS
jgi:hypothetical protein